MTRQKLAALRHSPVVAQSNSPSRSVSAVSAPQSEAELLGRVLPLAGLSLGQLAHAFDRDVPMDLKRAKGWVGGLMERALGATASSRAVPDFESIGVELKTLPVSGEGRPLESTFVCTIPLSEIGDVEWSASRVRRKLSRVLWVPVEGERTLAVAQRRIGTALLWSPSAEDEQLLRFDWEELAGIIGSGQTERITGHLGKALQVRPKASSSHARRLSFDSEGVPYAALPRGFYLRASFTEGILRRNFHYSGGAAAD
jgi:DNA mismatch repair protein MutH